jgi:hypothetical protein
MNEGAGRGFVLIAIAVLVGAVLLGKGLDDSSPRVSTDDGSSSGSDTTEPTGDDQSTGDTISSPVDPTSINVVVANGSGVSGAAGAVSETLAGLGYPPPIATDAFAEADTPLDTVYFATNPDSSAQAQQVATDLGLDESAVLPYPATGAPADIGLAQVLVVLGSSPGMLATGTAGATPTTAAG